jgi:hypothetical protein
MPIRVVLLILTVVIALPLSPTASPLAAKKRSRVVTRTFANPAPIDLPSAETSPVSGSLYPSVIAVSGLKGKVRDVDVTLNNLQQAAPDQVQVLLVGPRGQTAIVMASIGGIEDIADVSLRLDDEAALPLPSDGLTKLQSGTFRPNNAAGGAIPFNAPAPSTDGNSALSVFDGSNPNGAWRLFAQDFAGLAAEGAFSGGRTPCSTGRIRSPG